jgi:hypothetical protein
VEADTRLCNPERQMQFHIAVQAKLFERNFVIGTGQIVIYPMMILFVWELELEFFLRPTVSRPVRLGIGPPFGTLDQILSCSSFV